jgi:5-formyltetrahydrofolate cyclo-ligase
VSLDNQKKLLRDQFFASRKSINEDQNILLSNKIANNFLDFINISNLNFNKKIIASYKATKFEVNPIFIEEKLTNYAVKICYPKINDTNETLDFIEAKNFIFNKRFNKILEPNNGNCLIPDYVIVPLVAFDEKLTRLGMGKGYYDRTIIQNKLINPNLKLIGVAFDTQRSSKLLPFNNIDQSLDFVVTPTKIFFA